MKKVTLFCFLVLNVIVSSAQLNADFSLTPTMGCSVPHTVFFTDQSTTPDTWLWNFGDGSTSRAQNPIHTYTSAGTFNVSLTITDTVVGGSSNKTIIMAVVVEAPTADFSASPQFGCGPLTVNFTNASTSAVSYLWNFGDGTTSTLLSPSHTYDKSGLYSISLKITTANGCTNTRTKSNYIQVFGPGVNFGLSSTSPTSPPYTFNFKDSTIFSSPPASWFWKFGDGNTSTLQNPTHTYTTTDTFDVSLKVIDFDGCSRTFTRPNFVITKLFNATAAQTSAISCNGNSDGAVTVSPSLGTAPYSYSWSNGATTALNSGLSAGTYTVTVTDANSNFVTSSLQIVDPIADNPNFSYSAAAFCKNESNPTPTIAGTTGGIFKSTAGLSIDSTTGAIDLSLSTIGTYNVTYTTSSLCPESSSVSITINPIPQVVLTGPLGACLSSTVTLTATTDATGYNFDFIDHSLASLGSGTISGANSNITITLPSSPGNYTYKVKVLNVSTSCLTTESITINVANPDDASFGFGASSYCNNEPNPIPTISGTTGGSFSSSVGLNINSTTGIIDLPTSTVGSYLVKYVTNGSCPDSSDVNFTVKSISDSTLTISSCDSYTWPQNGITYFNSGQFLDTIPSTLGCDSIVTLDLTINSVNSSITIDSNESCIGAYDGMLTAVATGGTSPYTYSWSNSAPSSVILGITSATYTVGITDANGCTSSSSATIIVLDTIKPKVVTQNVLVYLDATGNTTITPSIIDNGSSDACGAPTLSLRKGTFNCSEVGVNTIQLIATDVNGNIDSATATVTVIDTIRPTVITHNKTIYLDASGAATITSSDIDNGSTDICGTPTLSLNKSSFSCADVGTNTVQLIALDANNNLDSASAIVTVIDSIKPTIITQNITVYLNATGNSTITTSDIDNGSNDACGAVVLSLDSTSFNCSEVGINTVTLTGIDVNGNTSTNMATVTVIDSIKPTVMTQNITVYLDATGNVTITPAAINNGSSDICGTPTLSLRKNTFNCSEVGANTIQLIATDINGNIDSTVAIVTVVDTIRPTVITQNKTIYLDASGAATITPSDIDNGSTDICGTPTLSLNKSSFSCADVGTKTIQLIALDANNNLDSASAIITVIDTIKPTIITQNINLYLDASGNATIIPADIDNGSSDICGAVILSLDSTSFDCSEVGINTVTLTGIDVNGNTSTNTATVSVIDSIKPTVITQNITVYLDATGNVTITPAAINNGSSDICGTPTLSLRKNTFNCSEVGANSIQLIATDINGNIDSTGAIVTVVDTIRPTVITQNKTIYLDATGAATITSSDIDNGSTDICGNPTLSLSKSSFSCADVGTNTIQLIAVDANNNIDSSSAIVTVLDTIKPTIITQNVSVYLNALGSATVSATDIDNGSSDICGAVTLSLDSTLFDCAEVGINTVTLTGIDVNGNTSTNSATVSVFDTIRPLIMNCPSPIIQTADAGNCSAVVSWTAPTAQDNCGIDSIISSHNPNDVFTSGTTTVTYIAYDESLNTDTCSFTITITNTEKPVITNLPADTVLNNETGTCGAVYIWSTVTANDNCLLDSLVGSHTSGDVFPVGTTTVTYTAYDNALNTFSASFTVTVNDTEVPTIVCPSNISQCDSIVSWTSPVGLDNCAGSITNRNDGFNLFSGDQFPKGITTISYQVMDAANNQATCSFDVEVYTPPTANAGPDLSTRDIEPIQILANTTNANQIYWSPSTGLSDPTKEQPFANPRQNTTYTLRVVSSDGCEVSDDVEIIVELVTQLEATTLFTPNGDGRNDRWVVNKPELITGCQLVIFNRNGTEVYSTNNYNNEWDGTIRGEELPEGTYYYVFSCDGSRQYKGPITILRERR